MKKFTVLMALCLILSANAAQTCNSSIVANTPDSRFTTSADTVIDTQTGLIWMHCSLGQSGSDCSTGSATAYTGETVLQASLAVNAANTFGHNDWRLPNIKELASIVETKCSNPAINTSAFPNTLSDKYWSSSPYVPNDNDGTWCVDFRYGNAGYCPNGVSLYVRLVRDLSEH